MTTITTLLLVPQAFDRACERMQQAQQAYTEALNALAEATCSLEFRRAEYLAKGVEGKNAEVREAKLRLLLFDEYAEQLGLEVSLNEARRDLETHAARVGRAALQAAALGGAAEARGGGVTPLSLAELRPDRLIHNQTARLEIRHRQG